MQNQIPKNGCHITYYSNEHIKCPGAKWKEENYKDGQLNGLTIRWDEDGKINGKTNYKDGKRHGEETRYRYGYKDTIINFKNDSIDGICTRFYSNGQKQSQGQATDTSDYDYPYLLKGKWTNWFATGEKESEKYYEGKNELVGEHTYWYRNGQMRCIWSNRSVKKYWDREGNDITSLYFLAYSKKDKRYLDFFKEQNKDDAEFSTFFDRDIPPF
jgi:antitoxin component YwqK of YwqJK toxin-antitoxin module